MKSKLLEKLVDRLLESESEGTSESGEVFEIGKAYLIRGVTYHQIGIVKDISGDFLILKDASWVADSGRLGECIANGTFNEVEYVGPMIVNMTAIVDAFPWEKKVPKETK